MAKITQRAVVIFLTLLLSSCSKKNEPSIAEFQETQIRLSTHRITTYSVIRNSKYLIVFETGLGDDHSVWNQNKLPATICSKEDVLMYDRAGYGKSELGPSPRNLVQLSSEFEQVVNSFANNRKLILVGHSIAGMILRDFAIKNPSKVAGMLLVDPSHEFYNHPTQEQEDFIYSSFLNSYGADFGATREARELIEDSQYMATLTNLPDVPIIVLTSMKIDASHDAADRQSWFQAHELLGAGVTDFTHISTTHSGHYIFLDEPNLVLDNLKLLISKLP